MKKISEMLPIVAFLGYLCKIMVFPATFPDAIVTIALIAYITVDHMRLTTPKLAKYEEELKILKEKQVQLDIDIKNVQASTNGLKLSVGMRTVNGKNI